MYYTNDTPQKGMTMEEQRAMKAQQLKTARQLMTEEFAALLAVGPEENASWTGCMTDLMEAAHIAYMQGTIRNDEGRLCTFKELVDRVCLCMHVKVPRNPRGFAYTADRRKGVRQMPLIERYRWQMAHGKRKGLLAMVMARQKKA